MAKFAATGDRATSTTLATVLGWNAVSTTKLERLRFFFLSVACTGTPGDVQIEILVQRYSADGTNSAITPKPIDFADAASLSVAGDNHTVEPTYTAAEVMLWDSFHQRGRLVWYAAPGGEIVTPATNEAGLGIQTDASSGTPTAVATMHAEE